jgi:diguanylate cyclase (GGDEF)-like protein
MKEAGETRRYVRPVWAFLKTGILVAACLAARTSVSRAQTPTPLTTLHAVHALSNADAANAIPVDFEATVTYVRSYERALFVQDGIEAIYVDWPTNNLLAVGDRVEIKGHTKASFRPIVMAETVTVDRHGVIPPAIPATFDQLIKGELDARMVTVYGVVHDAVTVSSAGVHSTLMNLHVDGGDIDVDIDVDNPDVLGGMLDAQVFVTGAASGRFDGKMQQTGVALHVTSLEGVKVIKRASTNPWSLPITPMDEIVGGYHTSNQSKRIRVHGTVTYYQPGYAAVLQDGGKSLWIMTSSTVPVRVGDTADATGFPDLHDGLLALTSAEIQDLGAYAPLIPKLYTWEQLASSRNIFDLVSIDATVVAEVRGAARDEYVLESDGNLFSAVYKHPSDDSGEPVPPMKQVSPESKVRATGVCFMNTSNPFNSRAPFDILLRSPDDISMVAGTPWVTVANLGRLLAVMCLVMLTVSVWVWMLRRRVNQQTAAITAQSELDAAQERRIAQLEQWRSRVLEDINSSRPLGDIVEHITEMVSFMLNGAPCWCDVVEGPRLGRAPASQGGMRIISRDVPSRSGLVLATLFVALSSGTPNEKDEDEALAAGVRLSTLSIETRKLYSDLVHRSEYDLLTDMYNRFSLDRHLQELIDRAREHSFTFGLIYVDLDDFKLVNDLYGHHIGDLYLQEVSLRMKRQLRTGDMLGRLGGDEFAALVSVARGRADVEEIAQRLERCFDAPFSMEGYVLRGAASVGIAIYPTDGTTSDALLSAADNAMYSAKSTRKNHGHLSARKSG